MLAAVTQSRWDYVNVRGFGTPALALALRLPGDYSLPLGSRRGIDQQESVAGLAGHSLLTDSIYFIRFNPVMAYSCSLPLEIN